MYSHEHGEAAWKTYQGPPPKMPAEDTRAYAYLLMLAYLSSRDLSVALAQDDNGWYPAAMDVPRLVIPCINSAGTPYWQARAMDSTTSLRYDSPSAPRGDSVVVVYPELRKARSRAVIVEGPMDALASAAFGYLGIATMGNNPAQEALDNIVRMFGRTHGPFIILPDGDDPAFGAKLIASFANRGAAASMVVIPGGKDLCDLPLTARAKFFKIIERSKR